MCENDGERKVSETRGEDHRSEPPPKKEAVDAAVVPHQPDGLATSWGERIGYSF
jgi:hypothetical protein